MAFCINCGQELPDGAKFCANCGTAVNGTNSITPRKTIYEGEIHKCPNCGDVLDAYELVCETCGYERRGIKATSSVRELQLKLEELYSKRPRQNIQTIFAQALSGGQLTNADEEIVNLIKNFSIPNTKEDIMEFLILASSNIDVKVYGLAGSQHQSINPSQREISDAWLAKFQQAYQKAQLLFGGSQELSNIDFLFQQKMKEIKEAKKEPLMLILGAFGVIIGLAGFILIIIALAGGFGH